MSSYLPIADYGVIGNLYTVALVGKNGALDWCCLPDFDSPSVFGRILDASKGGTFQVSVKNGSFARREYVEDTNILKTSFDTWGGRLEVTDFMPIEGDITPPESFESAPEIHRILHARDGRVEVNVEWSPRFDYARGTTHLRGGDNGIIATDGEEKISLLGLPDNATIKDLPDKSIIKARFELEGGDRIALVSRWGADNHHSSLHASMEAFETTSDVWRTWKDGNGKDSNRDWASPWEDLVARSEFVLKLLSYGPTDALIAAGTTSLPEEIGGVRNWDYRYSWIRDASLAAQALFAMGHSEEATAFVDWAEHAAEEKGEEEWGLHIMYDVHGNPDLPEMELDHLEGYKKSAPVRIGNGAADQLQLDVYGELIDAAYEIVRLGGPPGWDLWPFLENVANMACKQWHKPDYGLWEVRDGPSHFPYSKVRVWSALQKASRLVESGRMEGDVAAWRETQKAIREDVLEKGIIEEKNAFRRRYEEDALDASNLLIPLIEFMPFEDPRVQGTIDATLRELTVNDLVYRYMADDGLPGEEGAFGLCTFWMVDALALSDRMDEAYRIFETMAGHANDLGLYSEQVDPHSGELLGNFPQAFTHIGLINSLLYLAYKEGVEAPIRAPIGTAEHRESV